MRFGPDLPPLDLEECRRFWLTPDETLDVARLWEADEHSAVRKFFSNAVARGFIVGRASGTTKTSPRLFSLESALKTSVMYRLTRQGRPFDVASEVGEAAIMLLRQQVERDQLWLDIDGPDHQLTIVYYLDLQGRARTRVQSAINLDVHKLYDFASTSLEVGVCFIGALLVAILETYALKWRDARADEQAKRRR